MSDRENILSALREKPLKVYEIMRRAKRLGACDAYFQRFRERAVVGLIYAISARCSTTRSPCPIRCKIASSSDRLLLARGLERIPGDE